MGQTLGFISFGRVARAVAKRAAPFGLRMMAYDPFIQETLMYDHGVIPSTLNEVLSQSDFVSMHAPARGIDVQTDQLTHPGLVLETCRDA